MKYFTNEKIKKEINKSNIILISGLLCLIAMFYCGFKGIKADEIASQNPKDIYEVLDQESPTGELVSIDLKSGSLVFDRDEENNYYSIMWDDDNYMYIVYMDKKLDNEVNKSLEDESFIEIKGTTKTTSDDVKKLALSSYNSVMEDANKISDDKFEEYFTSVYIDTTDTIPSSAEGSIYAVFMVLFFVLASGLLLIGIPAKIKYIMNIKKISESEIYTIDGELNDSNSLYFKLIRLFLTKNYIVNCSRSFDVIKYENILWIYPYEMSINGIPNNKAIKIFTKDGKLAMISNISVHSKKSRLIYDEVWNTIMKKNPNVKIGFTKENITEFKKYKKELKR